MTFETNPESITVATAGTQSAQPASHDPLADARRRRKASLRRLLGAALVLGVAWFLVIKVPDRYEETFLVSGAAPNFEFTTFDGQSIRLADLRGQGVVLNFWASWCLPCRAEAGLLEETWRREQENGVVFWDWPISIKWTRPRHS
ncbi:MAG: TlpA family protein disulfide reductase [Caldilineaceae bacterium]|nr:TlpA family protein disulfide reductase [Caldilineaceae bacterium]